MRPSATSRSTRATFDADQLLRFRRGVNRCQYVRSSRLRDWPSIQPCASASSSACSYERLVGSVVPFFASTSHTPPCSP
jgi:hypothetical protein